MKKALVILCVLCLCLATVQAQQPRDYDRGIIFTFSGLSSLGASSYKLGSANNENVYGIGFKKYLSSGDVAIRPGLVFYHESENTDSETENYTGAKNSSTAFGFTVDYLKELNQEKITPFIGGGLGYIKKSSKNETGHYENDDPIISEESASAFLLRGIIGVEVYLRKNISLSGEYQLRFVKGSRQPKTTSGRETTKGDTDKMTEIGVGAIGNLNLTIYLP